MWLFLDSWVVVGMRTTTSSWNIPSKCGPHGELFFFFIKKEPIVLREMVGFGHGAPLECGQDDENTPSRVQNLATDFQTPE